MDQGGMCLTCSIRSILSLLSFFRICISSHHIYRYYRSFPWIQSLPPIRTLSDTVFVSYIFLLRSNYILRSSLSTLLFNSPTILALANLLPLSVSCSYLACIEVP